MRHTPIHPWKTASYSQRFNSKPMDQQFKGLLRVVDDFENRSLWSFDNIRNIINRSSSSYFIRHFVLVIHLVQTSKVHFEKRHVLIRNTHIRHCLNPKRKSFALQQADSRYLRRYTVSPHPNLGMGNPFACSQFIVKAIVFSNQTRCHQKNGTRRDIDAHRFV